MGRLKQAVVKVAVASAILAAGYFASGRFKPLIDETVRATAAQVVETVNGTPKMDLTGTYSCEGKHFCPKLGGDYIDTPEAGTVSIKRVGHDSLLLESKGKSTRFKQNTSSGFSYTNWSLDQTLVIRGEMLEDGSFAESVIHSKKGVKDRLEFVCKPVSKEWKIKAVFIRPCEGDFYVSFPTEKGGEAKTKTADGTLAGSCKDLKAAGITDVFIPFKVDDEVNSSCGKHGQLLYDSTKHGDLRSDEVKRAHAVGFDPIKSLMNECSGIRFHAWFPIFNDPEAAKLQTQTAERTLWSKVLDFFGSFFGKTPEAKVSLDGFAEPANAEVVKYELELLAEILGKYKVAGINLDYIRYSDQAPSGYEVVKNPDAITNFVKTVRATYPKHTLSADVKAGEGPRIEVGQNGILPYLDVIMPMAYTDADLPPADVTKYVSYLKAAYPSALVVPDLRGWEHGTTPEHFLASLKADIAAAKAGKADGYAIFTYEAALRDLKEENLAPTLK